MAIGRYAHMAQPNACCFTNSCQKLSEYYEALRNKQKSAKRVDPLTKLPKEIVEKIFDHLGIKSCV